MAVGGVIVLRFINRELYEVCFDVCFLEFSVFFSIWVLCCVVDHLNKSPHLWDVHGLSVESALWTVALCHLVQINLEAWRLGCKITLYFNVTKVFIFNNILYGLLGWLLLFRTVFSHDTFAIDLQQNDLLIVSFFI